MRCRRDRSRDLTEATLLRDILECLVFIKQSRSSRLSNAHDKRRGVVARALRTQRS
jgi:hypothetical protein